MILFSGGAALAEKYQNDIYKAASNGDLSKVKEFLSQDPNFNINEDCLLRDAVESGNVELVKFLIDNGANVNCISKKYHLYPLRDAFNKGDLEMVRFLIERGADVNIQAGAFKPLQQLAFHTEMDLPEIAQLLIDKGALVDADSKSRSKIWSPLLLATKYGNSGVVEVLLKNGADPNHKDENGNSSLIWAVLQKRKNVPKSDYLNIISSLLRYKANMNEANDKGYNAVHYAIYNRRIPEVQLFLANGADPNLTFGKASALAMAIQKKSFPLVKILVEAGVNINKVSETGESALHFAVAHQTYEIAEFLLDSGINKELRTNQNLTALDYAKKIKNSKLIRLLE